MNGPDELYMMDCNGTQQVLQQSTMGEGKWLLAVIISIDINPQAEEFKILEHCQKLTHILHIIATTLTTLP